MRLPTVKGAWFDVEAERFKLFVLLVAIVTLIISGSYTVREARYALFGQSVTAKVANVRETSDSSHRRPKKKLRVDYEIATGNGEIRREHEQLPLNYAFTIGQEIRLQHIPGVPHSTRLPRYEYAVAPLIFTAMMLVVVTGLGWLAYQANS